MDIWPSTSCRTVLVSEPAMARSRGFIRPPMRQSVAESANKTGYRGAAGTERILSGIRSDTNGTERGRELLLRELMLRLYLIANTRLRFRGRSLNLFGHAHAISPGVTT